MLTIQIFMMLGIALLLGLVFFQADDDFTGVQDRYTMYAWMFIAVMSSIELVLCSL